MSRPSTCGLLDDDGWKSVKPFLQKNPMNYSVVVGNPDLGKL